MSKLIDLTGQGFGRFSYSCALVSVSIKIKVNLYQEG